MAPARRMLARARRGMSLIEVMAVMAIMVLVAAIALPAMDAFWLVEQRAAARKITLLYELLHDEAVLRNQTFRVVFDLDQGKWFVERTDGAAIIYATPEDREKAEELREEKLDELEGEALEAWKAEHAQFQKVDDGEGWSETFELPKNTRFKSVFTPQYEEPLEPLAYQRASKRKKQKKEGDAPEAAIATSHVFSNGFSEFTVIQLVDVEDEEQGFTIIVDPMSGKVTLKDGLVDHEDLWDWLPDEAPALEL